MSKLVTIKGQRIFCDSQVVADKFGKKHAYVTRVIQGLISDFDQIKGDPESPLIQKKEGEYRGKKYIYYEMDKEFFTHLAMRFKGKKAFEWQGRFVKAFFQMEQALLRQANLEWQREREQGKQIRLEFTDTTKDFVDYATVQGSINAAKYYITLTKLQYKALGLIEKNEKVDPGFRNTLDTMELSSLLSAERVARKALMDGMNQKLHYKDIYQLAKIRVLQLADIMVITSAQTRKRKLPQ